MKLLESIKVGKITFKNRVMFPPLTTGYEEQDGSIGEQSFNFYKRLAEGGVGYIVIGDVVPVPTVSPTPKLFMDSQIEGFKKLADELHRYDCKLGLQIFHPDYDAEGLINMIKAGEARPVVFKKLHYDMTHFVNEVTKEQLLTILERIKACVLRAIRAGVDVIEVHGDRLIGSLTSQILNKRNDEFGGSFENRVKFALMVVDAIREISPDITLDYKLPIVCLAKDGTTIGKGGLYIDEAVELAALLEKHGVDTIHVAQANHTGNMNDTIPAMGTRDYVFMKEECLKIRKRVSIPLSLVGRIVDVETAENLLNDNVCDIVAFGRPLLCDPDIVNKCINGEYKQIRKCISCNKGCTDAIQSRRFLSCILNAENGYEYKRMITKADKPKRVCVIGAGIAGLEAARVLALKGHSVTIFEKEKKAYGQLNIAAVPPRKSEMLRICDYYDEVLNKLNVNIIYNHEFSSNDAQGFDHIIAAIGATNAHPPIKGIEYTYDAWDILGGYMISKRDVIICGGGLVGAETAEYLGELGYNVSIIEMLDSIAKEESSTIMPTLMSELKRHNTQIYVRHRIKEIKRGSVICEVLDDDNNVLEEHELFADTIVNALASHKNKLDVDNLAVKVTYIGDCMDNTPCNIENAIKSAYDAANSIN